MHNVYQQGRPTGCMAACVASILEIPLNDVPECFDNNKVNGQWTWDQFKQREWLAARGCGVIELRGLELCMYPPTGGILCIVSNPPPAGFSQSATCVSRTRVCQDHPVELVHNPSREIDNYYCCLFDRNTIVTFLIPLNDKIAPGVPPLNV